MQQYRSQREFIRKGMHENEARLPRNKPRDRYVTNEEFLQVRSIAQPNVALAMDLALEAGMRQADILNLKKSNRTVDGISYIPSKTGRYDTKGVVVK